MLQFYHNLPLLSSYHAARINVSRNAFLNSHSGEKKNFLWRSYRVKTNQNVVSWSVLLSTMSTLHYSFPKQCRFLLLLHLEQVCKSFRKESWRVLVVICIMQRVLFQVEVGVFNCQQVLRWFLNIALRIPTAHDFRVISARKLARARTQRNKFPSN